MKAAIQDKYGSPEVVKLREVERPELTDDGVLVRVRATSINRMDWYAVAGKPLVARPMMGVLKPRDRVLGGDFAGTVEAVGADVTDFRPGDQVFGVRHGAFAEYVCIPHDRGLAVKPANLSFEEAAAVPIAALTALQGLRDHGRLEQGQQVLVNGASGGVGTFAVQLAKWLGADVTAVCSPRNVERMRSLGADHVVDYSQEDFTRRSERYDLLLDVAGSRSWRAYQRVLKPRGMVVVVGGPMTPLVGPLGHIVAMRLASLRSSRKSVFFVAKPNRADMDLLRELLESGKVKPVVERRYELSDVGDALRYMGEGHAQGKIVVGV